MNKERFAINYKVHPDTLPFKQYVSDQYGCEVPGVRMAKVGKYEVWDDNGNYTVTLHRSVLPMVFDLRPYLVSAPEMQVMTRR